MLSISFPSPVPELLEVLGFLFLDLRKFIKLDCVSPAPIRCYQYDSPSYEVCR